ncbi:MAG TPA: PAS domain-containing protein [bacterium]|jgi:PAS domain S-box-containing protein
MGKQNYLDNENLLKLFVEHTPAAVAMFDRDMRYILCSRRWLEDYNLGDEEIIGRSHYDIFPEIRNEWKEIHQRCLEGEVMSREEDPFPRADGSVDWVKWEIQPWRTKDGGVGGLILFTEVLTSRKEIEEKFTESESVFRMLFENMNEGVALHELIYNQNGEPVDYRILQVNKAYERHTGLKVDEAQGKKASDLYGTGVPPYFDVYMRTALNGEPAIFETYFEPMKKHFLVSVCSPYEGCFATVFEDITRRIKIEEDLHESQTQIEEMLEKKTQELQKAQEIIEENLNTH